jgi:hypothetical protein
VQRSFNLQHLDTRTPWLALQIEIPRNDVAIPHPNVGVDANAGDIGFAPLAQPKNIADINAMTAEQCQALEDSFNLPQRHFGATGPTRVTAIVDFYTSHMYAP